MDALDWDNATTTRAYPHVPFREWYARTFDSLPTLEDRVPPIVQDRTLEEFHKWNFKHTWFCNEGVGL